MDVVQNQVYAQPAGYFKRLSAIDWLYAVAWVIGAVYALTRFGHHMDVYEEAILVLAVPTFTWLGWHWKSVRWLTAAMAVLALFAISLYDGSLAAAEQKFFLKYLFSADP